MKRKYNLKGLGCASCASKMACAIEKLEGVSSASINYFTQKLILEADETRIDEIARQAAAICRRIEPDCELAL